MKLKPTKLELPTKLEFINLQFKKPIELLTDPEEEFWRKKEVLDNVFGGGIFFNEDADKGGIFSISNNCIILNESITPNELSEKVKFNTNKIIEWL